MKSVSLILVMVLSFFSFGQSKDFRKVIDSYLTFNADTISVESAIEKNTVVFVDCRAKEEYEVSKIEGAIYYENFNWEDHEGKDIVVYCSIGKRSEDYSVKLVSKGAKKVFNLYGGIFDWVNKGNPVVNQEGQETEEVHTYSKRWSKWLIKGKAIY